MNIKYFLNNVHTHIKQIFCDHSFDIWLTDKTVHLRKCYYCGLIEHITDKDDCDHIWKHHRIGGGVIEERICFECGKYERERLL